MPSLRDLRTRIGSVKNTRQITNAMKMVSAAKLRRATAAATAARPYQQALTATLQRVAAKAGEDVEHPLLTARSEVKKVLLVVFSSDRGLCGGFNNALVRRTDEMAKEMKRQGKEVSVRSFGKRCRDGLKVRGHAIIEARAEIKPAAFEDETQRLSSALTEGFANGDFDEAWLCFNQYRSALSQPPTFTRVLPLSIESGGDVAQAEYIYEPGARALLGSLLPLYLRTLLFQCFLETEAGEHAARMSAMDSATRNASDLIDRLTLEYNRTRQAFITKELIEIISGAEAL